MLGPERRNAVDGDRTAVGRAEQVAVLLRIMDRELSIGGIRAQRRKRRAQVAEPVRRKVRGRPQEPLPGGGRVGDEREDFGADRHGWRRVGVPLDPVEQRGLADSRDRRRLGGAPPRLPAHLMLEEGTHPQPRTLPAERNRRTDKAPAMDVPARIQDSAQSLCRFFEQAQLPSLEVIDPDRQPAVPGRACHAHGLSFFSFRAGDGPDDLSAHAGREVPSPPRADGLDDKQTPAALGVLADVAR